MFRRGDTLIEVTLAIGIFSMVAIAIVAVMRSGISSSQTTLETTLARQVIDSQAEALRFIHSSYIADEYSGDSPFTALWEKITSNAVELSGNDADADILQYSPGTCNEIYSNDDIMSKAFVINTRALTGLREDNVSSAYIDASTHKLTATSTHPRLIFSRNQFYHSDTLIDETTINSLYRAEGIHVVAVKDPGSTKIVNESSPADTSAYYDFYIRTCWYGAGADRPSTISTIIRLYSPPSIGVTASNRPRVTIYYLSNGGPEVPIRRQVVYAGESTDLPRYAEHETFVGWNTAPDLSGGSATWRNGICTTNNFNQITANGSRCIYTAPSNMTLSGHIYLYAMWEPQQATVRFDGNGSTGGAMSSQVISRDNSPQRLTANAYLRMGYAFNGWCTIKTTDSVCPPSARAYSNRDFYNYSDGDTTLYALWKRLAMYMITFDANGGAGTMPAQVIHGGTTVSLTPNQFTYPGATFIGWNTKRLGTGNSYPDGGTYTAPVSFATTTQRVTLYAQWEINNYIQDVTNETCRNLASSANLVVKDRRDNKSYNIRYANGRCWMAQDLAISGTVYSKDASGRQLSNFTHVTSVNLNSGDTSSSITEPRSYASGVYYNFCAAAAGMRTACNTHGWYYGENDICPANWKMPTEAEIASVRQNSTIFSSSDYSSWWTSTTLGVGWDGQQLQCGLWRVGNDFVFPQYITSCRRGSYWHGFFRDNFVQIRCVHR